jgi:hypothetical protein
MPVSFSMFDDDEERHLSRYAVTFNRDAILMSDLSFFLLRLDVVAPPLKSMSTAALQLLPPVVTPLDRFLRSTRTTKTFAVLLEPFTR